MLTPEKVKQLQDEATQREIWDHRVLVVGGGFQYIKMFFDAGFKGAQSVQDANFICFTGGSDVTPSLYNEAAIAETYFDPARDKVEQEIFAEAAMLGKPMIGICRGSQFLTVMNGGKLWQDVNNHAVGSGHEVVDLRDGSIRHNMTSTHHQMMRPPEGAEILAVASRSTVKKSASEELVTDAPVENSDIEVVWYPKTSCLAFQPHPEFAHGDCRDFFLNLVDEYVMPAC